MTPGSIIYYKADISDWSSQVPTEGMGIIETINIPREGKIEYNLRDTGTFVYGDEIVVVFENNKLIQLVFE